VETEALPRRQARIRATTGTTLCVYAAVAGPPDVVVTRERGKNDKLIAELQQRGVNVLELPLVESTAGPDRYAALNINS